MYKINKLVSDFKENKRYSNIRFFKRNYLMNNNPEYKKCSTIALVFYMLSFLSIVPFVYLSTIFWPLLGLWFLVLIPTMKITIGYQAKCDYIYDHFSEGDVQ